MTIDMHIVRKIAIGIFLSLALVAELTILATAISALDYATGPASTPSPISAGSAINSGASGTSNPPIGSRQSESGATEREFAGGARCWNRAAHCRLLCRISKYP